MVTRQISDSARAARKAAKPKPQHLPEVLRTAPAAAYIGAGTTLFWTLRRTDPSFPKPIILGTRARGYRRSDLDAWIERRALSGEGAKA